MSIVYSKNKDGVLHVAVCGKLTRDPEIKQNTRGDKVRFSVCYAKAQYMDCDAWADSDAGHMAMCLEKGDIVLAMGIHRSWVYNDKSYQSVSIDGVFPMSIPTPAAESYGDAKTSEPGGTDAPQKRDGGWEHLEEEDGDLPF